MRRYSVINELINYLSRILTGTIPVILLTFLFIPSLLSQEVILSGTVSDRSTLQALKSVSINDKTSRRGTVTDNSGKFRIALPPGERKIEFSYTGYPYQPHFRY
jgi:hypothetical protein